MCVSGNASSGCAASASTWHLNPECNDACDLSGCDGAEPDIPPPSCETCGAVDGCAQVVQYCSRDNPYICLQGSAMHGCSPEAHFWVIAQPDQCSACCDGSQCAFDPVPDVIVTRLCTYTECIVSRCDSASYPFECISGSAAKGCAASASTWHLNPECNDACDLSACDRAEPDIPPPSCETCGAEDGCAQVVQYCSRDNPYICLQGSAVHGCSSDALLWATSQASVCGLCCDGQECAFEVPSVIPSTIPTSLPSDYAT